MARYGTRRRRHRFPTLLVVGGGALVAGWWIYPVDAPSHIPEPSPARPALTTDRPEVLGNGTLQTEVPERGESPLTVRGANQDPPPSPDRKLAALIESGKKALARNDLLAARGDFSEAINLSTDASERAMLRAELTRIGNETIFSSRVLPNDPLVDRYVIKPGDSLGKIATAYKVSDDLIARVNGIRDKNRIRAGQAIKIIKGPFRAVVNTEDYSLGLYLGNTFVKQFRVGLGQDESTPRGEWEVATKLVNPTYYPPRGGHIVAADDPNNPLGERWIGLHGISGEAVGQLRYGIHGTNEPDSIGKSVSLGCVRMHNEDVETVFECLVEKHSTVIIQ